MQKIKGTVERRIERLREGGALVGGSREEGFRTVA